MISLFRADGATRGVAAALLALVVVLTASPADAGDLLHKKKHRKLTFELVQGYMVQPPAAQPIYVPVPYPVPVGGDFDRPSGQHTPSGQGSPQVPAKTASVPSGSLFNTLSAAPILPQPSLASLAGANPFAGLAAMPMQVAAMPVQLAAMPMQVAAAPVQMATMPVQMATMPVQLAAMPVQLAAAPLVQATTTLAAAPVQPVSIVAQQPQALTPVQFLLPKEKHCLFSLFGH